jgi:chromosome segregation ATPase
VWGKSEFWQVRMLQETLAELQRRGGLKEKQAESLKFKYEEGERILEQTREEKRRSKENLDAISERERVQDAEAEEVGAYTGSLAVLERRLRGELREWEGRIGEVGQRLKEAERERKELVAVQNQIVGQQRRLDEEVVEFKKEVRGVLFLFFYSTLFYFILFLYFFFAIFFLLCLILLYSILFYFILSNFGNF